MAENTSTVGGKVGVEVKVGNSVSVGLGVAVCVGITVGMGVVVVHETRVINKPKTMMYFLINHLLPLKFCLQNRNFLLTDLPQFFFWQTLLNAQAVKLPSPCPLPAGEGEVAPTKAFINGVRGYIA